MNISNESVYNYYEFILIKDSNKKINELNIYDYNFNKDEFYSILQKINEIMSKKSIKPYQREWKEYVHADIYYKNYSNNEIKIYKKTHVDVEELLGDWILIKSLKTKHSPLNYSCTTQMFAILYTRCLIYRVNNRIYINFENSWNEKTNKNEYKIYINYNHDNNVDLPLIKKKIIEIINIFTPDSHL